MKNLTHLLTGTMIVLGAAAFVTSKSKLATPTHTNTASVNPVWFNTIEISEGITVEFEYGSRLEVFVEGDKNLTTQLAIVLENNILKASGKTNLAPLKNVTIKVVTPVLINLASMEKLLHTNDNENENSISQACGQKLIVQPVLMQPEIFQVYAVSTCKFNFNQSQHSFA